MMPMENVPVSVLSASLQHSFLDSLCQYAKLIIKVSYSKVDCMCFQMEVLTEWIKEGVTDMYVLII